VIIALILVVALVPASANASRHGPPGTAFYKPPSPLPGHRHGDLIWSRPIANPLTSADHTTLVLYRSTSLDGKAIAVSGTVSFPKGRPPKGGWPVISWAHMGTGVADRCAPSRIPHDLFVAYVVPQLNAWLRQGYAITRSDYEGLGTPGTHPYLIGHSEARGVIDIVRAAGRLDSRISRRWVAGGHGGGGHSALFAAADGPKWAPDLRLRGVAAFSPASHIGEQARAIGALTEAGGATSALAAEILAGAATVSPDVKPAELLSDKALPLFPQVEKKCHQALTEPDVFGRLAPSEMLREGADQTALLRVLDAQNPGLKIDVPVLLVQGLSDQTVYSFFTDDLNKQLRAHGDRVDYRTYPGVNHGFILRKSLPAANAFLRRRFG